MASRKNQRRTTPMYSGVNSFFPIASDCTIKSCDSPQKNCATCGWNRNVIEERKKDIRENGLFELENGLRCYIPPEYRVKKHATH